MNSIGYYLTDGTKTNEKWPIHIAKDFLDLLLVYRLV